MKTVPENGAIFRIAASIGHDRNGIHKNRTVLFRDIRQQSVDPCRRIRSATRCDRHKQNSDIGHFLLHDIQEIADSLRNLFRGAGNPVAGTDSEIVRADHQDDRFRVALQLVAFRDAVENMLDFFCRDAEILRTQRHKIAIPDIESARIGFPSFG